MKVKTAIILAAGMGTRLKELGTSIPKGFLKLGEKTIIEESIERLIKAGIERIIIVTGHLYEFYEELKKNYSQQVITVHNSDYANSGSLYSLYCAKDLVDTNFLLLESDLIYEQKALLTVLDFPQDNVILLSGFTHAGDEVYVEMDVNKLTRMSKNTAELGDNIAGELVGISKISQALFEQMMEIANLKFVTSLKFDYETDGLVDTAKYYPVYCTVVEDLIWAEIDDQSHLERAQKAIYPNLARNLIAEVKR
jgi:2-aminoethylphosphonate-pyruvate transaminase